ncbi:hypothetical protein B0O80DRAFT_438154 [Mortierella sp. GBAus27b]|nr:hypothetical protein BGX31_005587 [Mortierella sp. GBA43]KAI8361671.1 hypothetical protein B0O80DRAFT_438154 [Mortierella sp. GBAus27b]
MDSLGTHRTVFSEIRDDSDDSRVQLMHHPTWTVEQEQEVQGIYGRSPLSEPQQVSQSPAMPVDHGHAVRGGSSNSSSSSSSSQHVKSSSSAFDLHSTTLYRTRNGAGLSRPNSIVSSPTPLSPPQQQHKKKKESKTDGTKEPKEFDESFDRLYSMLTHLITDASTAVQTTPKTGDGGLVPRSTAMPVIAPLIYADSSDEEDNNSDDGEDGGHEHRNDVVETKIIVQDEQYLHQHYRHSSSINTDRDLRSMDSRVTRTRSRSFSDRNASKRRSLFMELQTCEPTFQSGIVDHEELHVEPVVVQKPKEVKKSKPEQPVLETVPPSWKPTEEPETIRACEPEDSTAQEGLSSQPTGLSLPSQRRLMKRRASFPTMRSEMIEMQNAEEMQEAIQSMDTELNRTVDTIDGLTRDLMAVATHQNWMQTRLEKTTMQLQGIQVGSMDPSSLDDLSSECGRPSLSSDETIPCHDEWANSSLWNEDDPLEHILRRNDGTKFDPESPYSWENKTSSRDLSQYFEALGKIAAMGQDLEDRDRTLHRGLMFPSLDDIHRKAYASQRSSGSSYTLNNDDMSYPMSPSECVMGTWFSTSSDLKKGGVYLSTSDVEINRSVLPIFRFSHLDWPRWRRATMPAMWPTSSSQSESKEEGLSFESAMALTNLLNMYASLVQLLFWTAVFAVAVMFVVPSLAEMSGQCARGLFAEVQMLLANPCDDQEAWNKTLSEDTSRPNSASSCPRRQYHHSTGQGLRHGARSRRKLNHQRVRRTLLKASKASAAAILCRGKLGSLNEESWSSKVSVCSLSSETTAAANTSAIFEDWE